MPQDLPRKCKCEKPAGSLSAIETMHKADSRCQHVPTSCLVLCLCQGDGGLFVDRNRGLKAESLIAVDMHDQARG